MFKSVKDIFKRIFVREKTAKDSVESLSINEKTNWQQWVEAHDKKEKEKLTLLVYSTFTDREILDLLLNKIKFKKVNDFIEDYEQYKIFEYGQTIEYEFYLFSLWFNDDGSYRSVE